MKLLYPEIEPYATHRLERDGHALYFEESGHPGGLPVLFLHGGPGSGCKPYHRCFFDPEKYRVILLDQRGSGRSTPLGELENNSTDHLIADLEAIRQRLGIERWVLFGGSWGATLALCYAQLFQSRVAGLILRGVFLARSRDLDWFLGPEGVSRIYPEAWQTLMEALPDAASANPIEHLYRQLTGEDELARRRAARSWSRWSGQVVLGELFEWGEHDEPVDANTLAQARIELHYATHHYFMDENALLSGVHRIPEVPLQIIHGRRDLVCPVESAWSLHRNLPGSKLRILPKAGHIASTDEMVEALVAATDEMAERLGF